VINGRIFYHFFVPENRARVDTLTHFEHLNNAYARLSIAIHNSMLYRSWTAVRRKQRGVDVEPVGRLKRAEHLRR